MEVSVFRKNKLSFLVALLLLLSMVLAACGSPQEQTAVTGVATAAATAVNPAVGMTPTTDTGTTEASPTSAINAEATAPLGDGTAPVGTTTGAAGGKFGAGNCPEQNDELLIYSSLPLTGPSRVQTVSVVNGMRMALADAGGKAGGYTVRFQPLDDATAAAGQWTPEKETENANKAIQDGATIYLGTFNSGAAAVSIPILNEAGIPMISPANTAINLTVGGPPDPGLFESLYKNGPRNYFRVAPYDRLQGTAAANWAKEMGVKSVYILHDQETYGLGLAQVFRARAEANGTKVAGFEGIDKDAGSYAALMQKVVNSGADLVYFAGLVDTGGPQLVKDLRDEEEDPEAVKFMGADGILESSFIEGAGEASEGSYGTVAAGPPAELKGAGKAFYDAYKAQFKTEPEPYAIFGYDTMGTALQAINKACSKDPGEVLEALNNLGEYSGALGTFSFDENGDTTLETYHGWKVVDGKWQWQQELSAEGAEATE